MNCASTTSAAVSRYHRTAGTAAANRPPARASTSGRAAHPASASPATVSTPSHRSARTAPRSPRVSAGNNAVLPALINRTNGPSSRAPTEYRPAARAPATTVTTAESSNTRLPAMLPPTNRNP